MATRPMCRTLRTSRRRGAALMVVLASVAMALGACGGGSSSSATTTATVAGSSGPDRAAMSSVLLVASDFPVGWDEASKSSGSTRDAESLKLAEAFPSCRGYVTQSKLENQHPKLRSPSFADSSMPSDAASEANNQVVGYGSEAQAKVAYGVYASAKTGTCLQNVFDKLLNDQVASLNAEGGPTATVGAQVERLGVPAAGDATTAYQITVSIDVAGTSKQVGFVVQIVRLGQYVVSYNATLYQAAPEKLGQNLVDRSMARLQAALG